MSKKNWTYDDYMDEATNLYNQQKQQNINQANNQSALAHSQYKEVSRNLNEINKAKGFNNTGYEGNTQVNAYNAYRNAVNNANLNAQATNNQLYAYYLQEMANLKNAKDTQANYELQNFENSKNNVKNTIATMLENEAAYDVFGNPQDIGESTATRLWNYIKEMYGENIPSDIIAELKTVKGLDKYVDFYNKTLK